MDQRFAVCKEKSVCFTYNALFSSHTQTHIETHTTPHLSLSFIYHHHHNHCHHLIYHHHHHRTPSPVATTTTTTTTTHPRRNHHHHRTPTATTVTGRIEGERSREEREIKGGDEREGGFRFGGFICLHLPPLPPPSPLHHNHHRHLLTVCSPVTLIPVLSFRIDGFRNRIFRLGFMWCGVGVEVVAKWRWRQVKVEGGGGVEVVAEDVVVSAGVEGEHGEEVVQTFEDMGSCLFKAEVSQTFFNERPARKQTSCKPLCLCVVCVTQT
ncbi:hypothetical protein Hanom_Chr07g00627081 [Helianthus anomalus]